MFAIVETGGKQYRVSTDQKIIVDKLSADVGSKITLDKVLLVNNGQDTSFGNPVLSGAKVEAEVLKNFKDDKIIIFKKRRRQNSRRKRGHRQHQTLLKITAIKG
ncbi:50S ribosomal protein L21 [Alphaproteobacteria bacterium]|nr:50S ribosomal protein L21 [Alphaproteobacteria bacterium]